MVINMEQTLTTALLNGATEKEYVKSPFRYHEGIRTVLDAKNGDCTLEKVRAACVKDRIDAVDFKVLRYLLKYQFLSRRLMELCFAYDVSVAEEERTGYESGKRSLKRRLAKLLGYGLVVRYYLKWKKTEDEMQERTPCFYGLTQGAEKILVKKNLLAKSGSGTVKLGLEPNEELLLDRLIANQFHILFMRQYGDKVLDSLYFQAVSIKGYSFSIDLAYRLKKEPFSLLRKETWSLVPLPVRRGPEWEQVYLIRLALISEYAKRYPERMDVPTVLVICEDDLQIKDAYMAKLYKVETRNITTYFTSDVEIMNGGVLSGLYSCSLSKEEAEKMPEEESLSSVYESNGVAAPSDRYGVVMKQVSLCLS